MTPVGAAFSAADDGNLRHLDARLAFSRRHDIPETWAMVRQVHGAEVLEATGPGTLGDADAIVTETPGLAVAVLTADCVGVVIGAPGAVAVAHAGWRGVAAGVVAATRQRLEALGHSPTFARLGPAIGPCCFEVGPEVVAAVGHRTVTRWGTVGVDLHAAVAEQLEGLEIESDDRCTMCSGRFHSHRGTGTDARQATVAWLA